MKKVLRLILAAGVLTTLLAAPGTAGGAPVRKATMDGEHPGTFAGDKNASGTARLQLYPAAGKICYDLRYENITVFHIDIRTMDDRELVQELYHRRPTDDRLSHCKRDIESSVIRAIKKHPARFFISASEYHGGDIAGTLRRP